MNNFKKLRMDRKALMAPSEVDRRRSEQNVDHIAESAPVKITVEPMVRFQMTDGRFYSRPLAERSVFLFPLVIEIAFLRSLWNHDLSLDSELFYTN
ncbi:MAG: hypothetical protein M0P13_00320 [Fibrobacteraceae bacterium]|nr:hypothetical protein [Fibrobacteraceae bacterium]